MKASILVLALLIVMILDGVSGEARAQCSPSGLNDGPLTVTSNGVTYYVFYTANTNSGDYFPASRAQWLRDMLPGIHNRHVLTFGLRPHYSNLLPDYHVHVYDDSDDAAATAYANCIVIEADSFRSEDEVRLRKTTSHEMFHTIQRSYLCDLTSSCSSDNVSIGGNFGKWVSEGQARFMDDRHFADLDTQVFNTAFDEDAVDTLETPEETVFDKSYRAALFWSYCAEQLGLVRTEPQIGVDFVRDWWEIAVASGTNDQSASKGHFSQLLRHNGTTFDDIFLEYSICNVAREYDSGALAGGSKYRYLDEQPGHGAAYAAVVDKTLHGGFPVSKTNHVAMYAASYHRIEVGAGKECQVAGFNAVSDVEMGFGVVASDASGRVASVSRQTGREFGRSFLVSPSQPVQRLDAVVAGLVEADDYAYRFGLGEFSILIARPDATHPAYPGDASEPGRFLARVKVLGPPELVPAGQTNLSIMGLLAEDFEVRVGTNKAPVISAGYVGSEYWLTCQAPEQNTNAAYNLRVTLCTRSATSTGAVQYGQVQLDHVVVLDRSGSMDDPAGYTKLDAAKAAAKLYLDSVSDGEGIAVVAFSGNLAECNDDAATFGTNKLYSADDISRFLFKWGVDNITPLNMTSIGDGLAKAENTFKTATNRPAAITNRYVVLLSDGMENEELYWNRTNTACGIAALRALYPANGIKVNAIAFGPGSDQPLMQDIGMLTGGDHSYVDVSASGISTLASGVPSMGTELKDAFLQMLEDASGLERVSAAYTMLPKGVSTVTVQVVDTDIRESLFFFGWDNPSLSPGIALYNPDHDLLDGVATVRADDEHKVYSLGKDKTIAGTYRAVVETEAPMTLLYGLLCDSFKGLQMKLAFRQERQGSAQSRVPLYSHFDQGVPVTILAMLSDRKGAVTDADVMLSVTLPDGSLACGPLSLHDDGRHGDGPARDGIYGAVFSATARAAEALTSADDLDLKPPAPKAQRGTYRVRVLASGKCNTEDPFTRVKNGAFTVFRSSETPDFDHDKLPDPWELHYGTNPFTPDQNADHDLDGLTNLDEFELGTHPFDQDTDRGGESDGSEANHGRCPLDPSDDMLPRPDDVEVIDNLGDESNRLLVPKANWLRFPRYSSYQAMLIYRSLSATGPFTNLIATVDLTATQTVNYLDKSLTPGLTYYYRLRARGAGNALSAWSRVIAGTPYLDPVPPWGHVTINGPAKTSDAASVWVYLDASPGTTHYRISNKRIEGAETLNIITSRVPWTLNLPAVEPGRSYVHVQFVKVPGPAGEPIREYIVIDRNGDADGDGTINRLDPDDDGDGLSDSVELNTLITDPFRMDTDGDGLSDSNEVAKGCSPVRDDTDADGLYDGEEILHYGTDPLLADSDKDGMPDGWEARNGLNPLKSGDGGNDDDHDSQTNYEEWLTGTNPHDEHSNFAALDIRQGLPDLRLRFPTLRGRVYRVDFSDDLMHPSWKASRVITGEVFEAEVPLPVTNVIPHIYYRIRFLGQ